MAKRKTKKRASKRKHSKQSALNFKLINAILALIILLIIVIAFFVYNLDTKELKESKQKQIPKVEKAIKEIKTKSEKELDKYFNEIEIKKDEFEEYTKDFYKEYVDKEVKPVVEKKDKVEVTPPLEDEEKKEIVKQVKVEDKVQATLTSKPKLAIVIDDVTTSYQINKIKDIGYKTSIAIMPPTKRHPNSADIAKDLPFYMIHFPLEATSFKNEENGTLHIGDSYKKIEQRVAQVRAWYPNAKYTNNHTGSKFTADYDSMDKLFRALVKYDFVFMDSRTTSKTVAKEMAKKYNMPYIVRNVFLDNEQDFDYIQNQLKKAIKIAKKNGYAIAISHPHSISLKVLKESKHLLKDLEMVYLNQIPILNK